VEIHAKGEKSLVALILEDGDKKVSNFSLDIPRSMVYSMISYLVYWLTNSLGKYLQGGSADFDG
jgi:hypothetical protein